MCPPYCLHLIQMEWNDFKEGTLFLLFLRERENERVRERETDRDRKRENCGKEEKYEKRMSSVAGVRDNASVVGRETEERGRGERK